MRATTAALKHRDAVAADQLCGEAKDSEAKTKLIDVTTQCFVRRPQMNDFISRLSPCLPHFMIQFWYWQQQPWKQSYVKYCVLNIRWLQPPHTVQLCVSWNTVKRRDETVCVRKLITVKLDTVNTLMLLRGRHMTWSQCAALEQSCTLLEQQHCLALLRAF